MRTRRKQTQLLFPIPAKPIVNWEFVTKLSSKENTNIIYLRDGEVVLYRRPRSTLWHCRFKLQDRKWERRSTQKASLENAMIRACEMYDEARFRQRLGLAHSKRNFAEIAHATLNDLKQQFKVSCNGTFHHERSQLTRSWIYY